MKEQKKDKKEEKIQVIVEGKGVRIVYMSMIDTAETFCVFSVFLHWGSLRSMILFYFFPTFYFSPVLPSGHSDSF